MLKLTSVALAGAAGAPVPAAARSMGGHHGLWTVWDHHFARARFVSLSHVLTQDSPVWKGFPPTTKFQQGTGRLDDASPYAAFTYEKLGVETTAYSFATDQFGTQLDPPAHWHPSPPNAISRRPGSIPNC